MGSKQYKDLLLKYGELLEQRKFLKDEDLICECFLISAGDIRQSLSRERNLIEDLPMWCFKNSDLGHGCGSCIKNQSDWKDCIINESET